ncbi:TPA: hypothetical protein ACGXMH_005019 [Bacillus mobilis]|uniref:hypothetical protein n=1 Tax=Bacillus mobilis TaxID=2026190 RepID=UPI0011A172A0|nr:hypothetical protein [Bacillus mobilis]MED4387036.1 hypothetical protein [Bacillus mobilis]HDX9640900.1 hypothetical protein [Bacillus mobilis]
MNQNNYLSFLLDDNKQETAAKELNNNNNTDNPLSFLSDGLETATNETDKKFADDIINVYKRYDLVEVIRKYYRGIELKKDEERLILDFIEEFQINSLKGLED